MTEGALCWLALALNRSALKGHRDGGFIHTGSPGGLPSPRGIRDWLIAAMRIAVGCLKRMVIRSRGALGPSAPDQMWWSATIRWSTPLSVMVAVSASVLIGAIGLGTEVACWYVSAMQNAADAATIALAVNRGANYATVLSSGRSQPRGGASFATSAERWTLPNLPEGR